MMFSLNRDIKSISVIAMFVIPLMFGLAVGIRPAFAAFGDVTLTPSTDTNFVGEEHTVTAQYDTRILGSTCTPLVANWGFSVTGANPNSGVVSTGLGEDSATFTYTGHN